MTLDELTTPATKEEIEEAIYATLAARGAQTSTWKPGAVVRAIITGISIVLAALSSLQAAIAKGGFLELATGDWLTLIARHVYDVERSTGSFATSVVTLDNGGGGVFSGVAGDLVFSCSAGDAQGKTYRNTEAFSIAALETGVEIAVEAVELGTASNALLDDIDTLETTLLGVTIAGSTAAVGADEETDAALRTRCRAKTGTLSPNGPRDAYHYVATSAVDQDGFAIGVTRVKTVADGNGNVDVYVADASGQILGDAADPATDLGAIALAIHSQVEPLAVTPNVQSATPLSINVVYQLWIADTTGLDTSEIADAIEERVIEWLASIPIGGIAKTAGGTGYVYVDALESVIASVFPDALVDVAVATPAADVAVAANEAPKLGPAYTPTITVVSTGVT